MKKIIAVVTLLSIVLCFVACGKEEIPAGYVVYEDVKGMSFLAPEEVVMKGADNEQFRAYIDAAENKENIKIKKGTHLLEADGEFGYMSSEGFLMMITPNKGLMNMQTVYDNDQIGFFVESMFPVDNVSSNTKSIVKVGNTTLSASVKAKCSLFGEMSGYFIAIERGISGGSSILVLATEEYMEANGKNADKLLEQIAKSLVLIENN